MLVAMRGSPFLEGVIVDQFVCCVNCRIADFAYISARYTKCSEIKKPPKKINLRLKMNCDKSSKKFLFSDKT
jgi:hypothetical protein